MTSLTNDSQQRGTVLSVYGMGAVEPKPLEVDYVLEYPIGRGATGRVWRARRRSTGRPVAIKVLSRDHTTDPTVVARFLRECATLRRLHHPNLITIDDVVACDDTVAAVMELVEGEDLRRIALRGGLDHAGVLDVLAQVARALAGVHAAGVLHRDVKPENIMVAWRHGRPAAKLTDFGLAWIDGGPRLTTTSQVSGTLAYLAPELLTSRPYGPPVDIYAIGVTAHELLSGRRPFEASHPLALMRAHIDEEPQRPPGVTAAVWRTVNSCLAKQPEARPTAAQLATEFERLRAVSVLMWAGPEPSVPGPHARPPRPMALGRGCCRDPAG